MLMHVYKLSGAPLDWAFSSIEKIEHRFNESGAYINNTSLEQVNIIVARERLLVHKTNGCGVTGELYECRRGVVLMGGFSEMVAIMRCWVACHKGSQVNIPNHLVTPVVNSEFGWMLDLAIELAWQLPDEGKDVSRENARHRVLLIATELINSGMVCQHTQELNALVGDYLDSVTLSKLTS